MNDNSARVIEVDINEILPNRFQPRIQFDEDEILELSDSIKEHGIIQPIVVRTIGDKYEIIAGERRYKASVLAGKESVPVIVKNLNDKDSAEIALIENIQRKNLTPIEEALSYKKILDMGYITQEKLASKLGKSQSSVANKIRLLNLSDEVQEALLENKISERHARSLLRLSTSSEQNNMLNRIITERLTVRKTDEEIDKLKSSNESNEGNNDSQKIIEKGEISMNNNINMMPNMPSSTPNFDMFGNQPQQPVEIQTPQQPTSSFNMFNGANPQPTVSNEFQNSQPSFDMFSTSTPNYNMNETIQTPVVADPVTQPIMGNEFNFNPTPVVESAPQQPSFDMSSFNLNLPSFNEPASSPTPVDTLTPSFDIGNTVQSNFGLEPQHQPQISNTPQFDANGMIVNESPVEQGVPFTTPIIENPVIEPIRNDNSAVQTSNNSFSFGSPETFENVQPPTPVDTLTPSFDMGNTVQPEELKMPEPIIITDYNKQYDPVMPQSQNYAIEKADFKEVIKALRECSARIEQYGYKINVEEFDLATIYQVVFKVEK